MFRKYSQGSKRQWIKQSNDVKMKPQRILNNTRPLNFGSLNPRSLESGQSCCSSAGIVVYSEHRWLYLTPCTIN